MIGAEVAERFRTKVRIDDRTGCWLWGGARRPEGYGLAWVGGRALRAHRLAWELFRGPIPEGLQIDHRVCRNKACVNPDHLVVCSLEENILQPDGAAGDKKLRTHCPLGHPLSGENLVVRDGSRRCRECIKMKDRERWKRRTNGNRRLSVTLTCERCGKEYHPSRGREKTSRFCSRECRRRP